MKSTSLFLNHEIARIEEHDDEITLLMGLDDGAMITVGYQHFKNYLKNLSFVFITSENEETRNDYIEFVRYFASL